MTCLQVDDLGCCTNLTRSCRAGLEGHAHTKVPTGLVHREVHLQHVQGLEATGSTGTASHPEPRTLGIAEVGRTPFPECSFQLFTAIYPQ